MTHKRGGAARSLEADLYWALSRGRAGFAAASFHVVRFTFPRAGMEAVSRKKLYFAALICLFLLPLTGLFNLFEAAALRPLRIC